MSVRDDRVGVAWWRDAVIYQIYIKSFADGNGDGVGDIAGMIDHVPDIAALGVDAVWVCPWFCSPMRDGGYDITDHRDIDPIFGDVAGAEAFIATCHEHGLRVLLDFVGNHVSRDHPWFQAALSSPPGSPERERFYFAPGHGRDGELPPTDWPSIFGGSAWTRESPTGEWYVHVFDSSQPDLQWRDDGVRDYVRETFRFWYDRGVDGFRLDAIPGMGKSGELIDAHLGSGRFIPEESPDVPFWDRDLVHDVLREWRAVADEYDPPRFLVGEVVVNSPERERLYTRTDELPSLLAIGLAKASFDAHSLGETIRRVHESVTSPAWPTWTVSSHDERRPVSRFAQGDLEQGRRRSLAVHFLALCLPGTICLYQGDELGLDNVDDLPEQLLQDPIFARTGDRTLSRDGCRVPLPWSQGPSFGFSTGASWLPQPSSWSSLTRERQANDPHSSLSHLTRALRSRRRWLDSSSSVEVSYPMTGVLQVARGAEFACWLNTGGVPVSWPTSWSLVERSGEGGDVLAPDEAAWFLRSDPSSTP